MIINATDYSDVYSDNNELAVSDNSENYGVRQNLGLQDKDGYKTSRFCGVCHLRDNYGNFITSDDGEKVILSLSKSRFEVDSESNAILNMLKTIANDEEFDEYLCMNLPEGERLITYFFDEELIFADEITEDNRLLTYISFIHLVFNSTKRSLMCKMVKKTENFTGKVRGRIDIKNQISKNIVQGRKEKIYCKYSEKSVDIKENQILKYALKIIMESKMSGLKNIQRIISILNRRFSDVSDIRVTPAEIDKIILPAMYNSYKPMFQLAKVIVSDISMYTTGNGSKKGLVPYAINMPLLFECYSRSLIKEKIEKINTSQKKYYIELKKFVADKHNDNMDNMDSSYGCRKVSKDKNKCYIQGYVIPDIVLAYYRRKDWDNGKTDTPEFYRIYDAKYKDTSNTNRDDRLQFLAYCFLYNIGGCNEEKNSKDEIHRYSGLLFPDQNKNEPHIAKINLNNNNDVYFHQCYINIDGKNSDFSWLEK